MAMFDNEIILRKMSTSTDAAGDTVKTTTESRVYATVKSIGQSEFYQAQSSGLKPELKFTVSLYTDYNGAQEIEYDGVIYKVLRTYQAGDALEIVVYGGVCVGTAEISHTV